MQIVVVGAGIGGLALAAALQHHGLPVTVYEQAPSLEEVGAGLSLWPNALAALDAIGLAGRVRAAASELDEFTFRTQQDSVLLRLDHDVIRAALGALPVAIHRADLQRILLEVVGPAAVQLGAQCNSVHVTADAATVSFEDRPAVSGDLVVGCDGIDSAVRASTAPGPAPRYAGYTSWRGVTDSPAPAPAGEYWGRGQRFGVARMTRSRTYWFAVRNAPAGEGSEPDKEKLRLVSAFADWPAPIGELIRSTPPEAIVRTDLYDRRMPRHWSTARTTLAGDAIHPMTPNLGQGACQAIEDAVVLADSLAGAGDLPARLRAYEDARRARVRFVVGASRVFGAIAQFDNATAGRMRDAVVKATPPRFAARRLARLAAASTFAR